MPSTKPRIILEATYEGYAQDYLRSLPLEHFMEATAQARQREITLESFALVKPHRPDLHVFNELLLQYPRPRQRRPGQVVPDNMIVLSDKPPRAESSYNLPLEPAGPFWVLEYVSKSNRRKDYDDNLRKYEQEVKVPYYLLFNPEAREMTLYRHNGTKYVSVKPNKHGRYAVRELAIEAALLDGWVRFWFKGDLLPLPADLQRRLDEVTGQLTETKGQLTQVQGQLTEVKDRLAEAENRLADKERAHRAAEEEVARLRAQLEQRNHNKGRS